MFDLKILAAVFATLMAMGGFMNGGADISSFDGLEAPEIPRTLGAFTGLIDDQKQDVEVDANVTADLKETVFELSSESLNASNMTTISIGKKGELSSDTSISLTEFDGTLSEQTREKWSIQGKASGAQGEGFHYKGELKIKRETGSQRIEIRGVNQSDIEINGVRGDVSSGSASTTVTEASKLTATRFSGNITILTEEDRVVMNGLASSLKAGDLSYS